jgi:hypothetical protein
MTDGQGPARGYRWEDAKPGNLLAVKHGAYSDRLVLPFAEDLLAELAPAFPDYLQEPKYRPAVLRHVVTLARIARLSAWLEDQAGDGVPEVDGKGRVRGAMDLLERLGRAADREAAALGLTPASAARLGRNVAAAKVDLAALWAAEAEQDAGGPDAA